MTRLGLWRSSFPGRAGGLGGRARPRVKVLHSQVGSLDDPFVVQSDTGHAKIYEEATKIARGEMKYPQPGVKAIGNLEGAPVRA
jgi:hypothetical protein